MSQALLYWQSLTELKSTCYKCFLIKKYLYNNIFNKVKNIHSVTFNEVGIVTIKGGANMKKSKR